MADSVDSVVFKGWKTAEIKRLLFSRIENFYELLPFAEKQREKNVIYSRNSQ